MRYLCDKIEESARGWYMIELGEEVQYFRINSFHVQSGSRNYKDYFFIAERFNESGELKEMREILRLGDLRRLKIISKKELPWIKNNKANLSGNK